MPASIVSQVPKSLQRRRSSAVSAASEPGHLYLVQFDNGVIKAGRTSDLAARNNAHVKDAGRFGLSVVNRWNSEVIRDVFDMEQRLLAVLATIGSQTSAGREYFRGVPFSVARYQAINLHRTRRVECCCGKCVDPVDVLGLKATVADGPDDFPGADDVTAYGVRLDCGAHIRILAINPDHAADGPYALRPADEIELQLECRPWDNYWTAWVTTLPRRLK